jgi:hypothetical protein
MSKNSLGSSLELIISKTLSIHPMAIAYRFYCSLAMDVALLDLPYGLDDSYAWDI